MTYLLYNRDGSGGFVVEAALALAGAPFELVRLETAPGTPLPEEFGSINPWRQVPALVLPDGSVMTESAAILIHLAACYPGTGLAPEPTTPGHATFLRWLVFASVNVYEAALRVSYPLRYTTDPTCGEATRSAATGRMGNALILLDRAVEPGPFLLGDTMSVADIYFAMLFIWFRGTIDAPRLTALTHAVRQHAIVAPIWQRHFGDR